MRDPRPQALGRNKSAFAGTLAAVHNAGLAYTLVQSTKYEGVDPLAGRTWALKTVVVGGRAVGRPHAQRLEGGPESGEPWLNEAG